MKVIFKNFILILVSIAIVLSLCSCSFPDNNSQTTFSEKAAKEYEKNKSTENLVKVIVYSINEVNLKYINQYSNGFLFIEESQKATAYEYFSSTWFEIDETFTEESVEVLYESLIWMYMYSFLYDSEGLQPCYYDDNKNSIDELYPELVLLLKENEATSDTGVLIANELADTTLLERFIGAINLSVFDDSKAVKDYSYKLAWEISYCTEEQENGQFFSAIYGNNAYYEAPKLKNSGKGLLKKQFNINELETFINRLTEKEVDIYNEAVNYFNVYPKEFADEKYYIFNFYSDEYVISFYGSTVFCISISDAKTGEILHMKYKLPTLNGLEWHVE